MEKSFLNQLSNQATLFLYTSVANYIQYNPKLWTRISNRTQAFITTAKVSQGIQNPLPKGVAVQVRPRAPYLSNRASANAGALLYLAQSYLFPKQVTSYS